jgi:hypothetical protein
MRLTSSEEVTSSAQCSWLLMFQVLADDFGQRLHLVWEAAEEFDPIAVARSGSRLIIRSTASVREFAADSIA